MRLALPLAFVAVLAGCSTFRDLTGQPDYVVTQASPTAITIRFEDGEFAQAQGRANAHCGQYQRAAVMGTMSPSDGDSVATFTCA